MQFHFSAPTLPKSGSLVILATKGAKLSPFGEDLDKETDGAITRALKANRFNGESGQFLDIVAPNYGRLNRILIAGVGKASELDRHAFEKLGGSVIARLGASGEKNLSVLIDLAEDMDFKPYEAAAHTAVGAKLRSYRFDKYRTKEKADKKPSLTKFSVLTKSAGRAETLYDSHDGVLDGVFFTRDLVSEPANVLFPKSFAERLQGLSELGVDVEILHEEQMREMGMGALLGVAQGSAHEPQMVIMRYQGIGTSDDFPLAFVGKGVTFDTGGISIKPAAGMEQMKWDMGGAGAVSGVMHALAARKARVNAVGVVGLVENMPSSTAQRPGDVVTSMSGQTIEVVNTDAEGRLVLADALTYVQKTFSPKTVIDLATLTGAMIISLGHEHAGCFSNDDKLAESLLAAGLESGDKLWRLPIGSAYDKLINTPIADMKNVGPRGAGSITAAQFLHRFIDDGVKWAHLDVAGTVWAEADTPLWEKGGTGYGVRLLDQFVRDEFEK
ncbi:MAG: leucyl aminopeptidase [Sphingomonadales bacterium]|jgi:leucyl aminopeptidase